MNDITQRLGGILPVLYSYFDEGGGLRPGGFAAQTDHCLDAGAGGVVLFGYVTQFYRLSFAEKKRALAETAEALAGRGLLAVTVMDATTEGQIELIRASEAVKADAVILQPPMSPPGCSPDWVSMIEAVAGATDLPIIIQNALISGTTLDNDALAALQDRVPNLVGVKAETGSADIAAFSREHGGRFRILTGNWGVEYPFFVENGAHGLIPAPNFVPEQVALHTALTGGEGALARALELHGQILPLMQFLRERPTVEEQLLLGKIALSERIGLARCAGRSPGPGTADPAIIAHVERLVSHLPDV
ncbi:dihydrodipicolinate synthase family protein [Oceaniglobus trochenteri]|uniref:dihydrodipicolinate synthase family protein n=1 Tax=Oceaniglobus trochenteri TaxID=2763260 RepID=UPI001CFFE127|nr:dihydrodipicolinate synthase family protein [Oceaniglobus trochenteri]